MVSNISQLIRYVTEVQSFKIVSNMGAVQSAVEDAVAWVGDVAGSVTGAIGEVINDATDYLGITENSSVTWVVSVGEGVTKPPPDIPDWSTPTYPDIPPGVPGFRLPPEPVNVPIKEDPRTIRIELPDGTYKTVILKDNQRAVRIPLADGTYRTVIVDIPPGFAGAGVNLSLDALETEEYARGVRAGETHIDQRSGLDRFLDDDLGGAVDYVADKIKKGANIALNPLDSFKESLMELWDWGWPYLLGLGGFILLVTLGPAIIKAI
jgi:hypothetical protein